MGLVFDGALGDAGDTMSPMVLNLFSIWPVQVPLAFVLPRSRAGSGNGSCCGCASAGASGRRKRCERVDTMTQTRIYTIGHSNHTTADLIALLKQKNITLVVDVRSQPYSRWVPQFNRETLIAALEDAGLRYCFMGDVLGGRPSDPDLYNPGEERPDYERMAQTDVYRDSIKQLLKLAEMDIIVTLCSEGDHEHCHRHLLITQSVLAHRATVLHIQPDGSTAAGKSIPKQLSLF